MQINKEHIRNCLLVFLFTLYPLLFTAVHAATTNIAIDANVQISTVSPYLYGLNSSGVYYKNLLTDPAMIAKVRKAGIKMWRFPGGAPAGRYDFKYNNYKGRVFESWQGWDTTGAASLEEELTFCNTVYAEALIGVNTSFQGPNGTGHDRADRLNYSGDYESYTGNYMPDTPANRAKYAADMVTYLHTLCDAHGWEYPVYYNIGNEWQWDGDGMNHQTFIDCLKAYIPAMKAVDPNIKTIANDMDVLIDIIDFHTYLASCGQWNVYAAGTLDESFPEKDKCSGVTVKGIADDYAASSWPARVPVISNTEWGDHYDASDEGSQFDTYQGAIFNAHTIYRHVKNNYIISCSFESWSLSEANNLSMFSGATLGSNPRYYAYVMYKNFGNKLLECYDKSEYTPGVTDYFWDYKDDHDSLLTQASLREDGHLTIMAINLSASTTYQANIELQNFGMSGTIVAYTMDQSNCYKDGPGPSSSTLTGQSNPIMYTFKPFTVTCLVINKAGDTTPPSNITVIRDGTSATADSSSTDSTTELSANWNASSDLESGIAKYLYAIGTTAGGTNVAGWTDTGTSLTVTKTALALSVGTTYYFSVKAQNGVGLQSMETTSNGQVIINAPVVDLRLFPNPHNFRDNKPITFRSNSKQGAEVKIYTITGALVRKLAIKNGELETQWNGANDDGEKVTRGIYIFKTTENNGNTVTGKLAIK